LSYRTSKLTEGRLPKETLRVTSRNASGWNLSSDERLYIFFYFWWCLYCKPTLSLYL